MANYDQNSNAENELSSSFVQGDESSGGWIQLPNEPDEDENPNQCYTCRKEGFGQTPYAFSSRTKTCAACGEALTMVIIFNLIFTQA